MIKVSRRVDKNQDKTLGARRLRENKSRAAEWSGSPEWNVTIIKIN